MVSFVFLNGAKETVKFEHDCMKYHTSILFRIIFFEYFFRLSVDRGSFDRQTRDAVVDFTADDEQMMHKQKGMKKWFIYTFISC